MTRLSLTLNQLNVACLVEADGVCVCVSYEGIISVRQISLLLTQIGNVTQLIDLGMTQKLKRSQEGKVDFFKRIIWIRFPLFCLRFR